jgi:phosphatidylinositol alpha-mannosyltransferase
VKVGIVVPFSWSYIGGVIDHAEGQAAALEELGVETRLIMGDDPPGSLMARLHPHAPRRDKPPASLISVGTSVTVLANESRPNVVLNPIASVRLRRVLARERFDLLHLHEPMTPVLCVTALAVARCPVVATWHATGRLRWTDVGMPLWGFLMDRIDYRIAVSESARASATTYLPGDYEIIPNGITIPPESSVDGRDNAVVFIGRSDPRKGLEVLLKAWPEVHGRTGARLRVVGIPPPVARLTLARLGVAEQGVDLLGVVVGEPLTHELQAAKLLAAPSLGGESFGMVLTRAFGCGTPVVASDIAGYRQVMTPEVGVAVPPGDGEALARALVGLLEDEPRRQRLGSAARVRALERFAWGQLARRLLAIYERVLAAG